MARIPEAVQQFLEEGRLAYVATASPEGVPHCVPKGSMDTLDPETLVFADLYSGVTQANIESNPNVAITIVNPPAYRGYLFKGTATIVPRGKEFDEIAAKAQRCQLHYKRAHHLVTVHVHQVVDLMQ